MTSSPSKLRFWLRRLLKTAGILAVLLVTLLVVAIIIDRFDEKIGKDTQAWLDYPVPAAPQGPNGYRNLLALDAQVTQPLDAAAATMRAEHAILEDARKSPRETRSRYEETRKKLLNPSNASISFPKACKTDCYDYLLSHTDLLKKLSSSNAALIERYDAMLNATVYVEDLPLDALALQPNLSLSKSLGLLHLGRIVTALQKGDAQTAYGEWARHQRFWQMAAAGSTSGRGMINAVTQLERNQLLLAYMLKNHPESLGTARSRALPVLTARTALAPVSARTFVHHFQGAALAFDNAEVYEPDFGKSTDRFFQLFYQRNASLNLVHRMFRKHMTDNGIALDGQVPAATDNARDCGNERNWLAVSNQYGKFLHCMGDIDYASEYKRTANVDAGAAELIQKLQEKR